MGWRSQCSDWVMGWMVKEFEVWQGYDLVLKVASLRQRPSYILGAFPQGTSQLLREAVRTLPSHAKVKGEWRHTSTSTYAFVVYTGMSLTSLYIGPY